MLRDFKCYAVPVLHRLDMAWDKDGERTGVRVKASEWKDFYEGFYRLCIIFNTENIFNYYYFLKNCG